MKHVLYCPSEIGRFFLFLHHPLPGTEPDPESQHLNGVDSVRDALNDKKRGHENMNGIHPINPLP
jgi:hypothetical protein